MHAADSGISVTSNSYYTDPWLFACKNDPAQNAIFTAVNRCRRLVRFAQPAAPMHVACICLLRAAAAGAVKMRRGPACDCRLVHEPCCRLAI